MKEICGKMVYESLGELVDPKHTAVIVVDMQNDFCVSKGVLHQYGMDVAPIREVITPQVRLIEAARRLGVLVVYIENTTERGCIDDSPAWLRFKTRERKVRPGDKEGPTSLPEFTVEGTWGQQVIDELKPRPQDPIVRKHRSSSFANTNLDQLLRSNGKDSLIMVGMITQGCLASTVRDAQHYDYYAVVASDCVASYQRELHEAALKVLAARCDVITSQDILREWAECGQIT